MRTSDHPATVRRGDDVSTTDGRRRPRIDWDAAFAYFASDSTISYPKVSRQFSVSVTSVGKHARAEHWNERRAELQAKAAGKLADDMLKPLLERNRDTLRAVSKARTHLLSEEADDPRWSDLPALVKLEQLLEGHATDRVDIRKVQPVIVAFVTRVARHVPESAKGDFAQDLDWLEGELLAIEGPEADAA